MEKNRQDSPHFPWHAQHVVHIVGKPPQTKSKTFQSNSIVENTKLIKIFRCKIEIFVSLQLRHNNNISFATTPACHRQALSQRQARTRCSFQYFSSDTTQTELLCWRSDVCEESFRVILGVAALVTHQQTRTNIFCSPMITLYCWVEFLVCCCDIPRLLRFRAGSLIDNLTLRITPLLFCTSLQFLMR